jgi:hypothetical protein
VQTKNFLKALVSRADVATANYKLVVKVLLLF